MDKQARLNTIRTSIKEHEAKFLGMDAHIITLMNYPKPDYYTVKLRVEEAISLTLLIEDLSIEAKSLQDDIDLDARIENL
jgi:hypothetical protein